MRQTERLSSLDLSRAAELIKQGSLVAFPTETVYGLGARIFDPLAIESIFKVKRRPADNPLIAHVSSLLQVSQIAERIPKEFYLLAEAFFPGPLTLVLHRSPLVPSIVSAGLPSIALRMPSHPIALNLISLVGEPLVAPSANLSGKPSSTQAEHVLEDFEGKIAAVIEGGKTCFGIESTVLSLIGETPVLLRPGTITKEQLEQVLRCPIEFAPKHSGPLMSPGMKYRHYCPQTPIKIFSQFEEIENYLYTHSSARPRMLLSLLPPLAPLEHTDVFTLCAKDFYSLLRLADHKNYHEILIVCDEELKKQPALMNRLLRAIGE